MKDKTSVFGIYSNKMDLSDEQINEGWPANSVLTSMELNGQIYNVDNQVDIITKELVNFLKGNSVNPVESDNNQIKDLMKKLLDAKQFKLIAGEGINIDNNDPSNPVISSTGGGMSLPLGTILPAVGKIDDVNLTLLDGKTLTKTGAYSKFCTEVQNRVDAGEWFACTEEEYQQDISKYGFCGKFVINSDNIKIPTITRFIGATITLGEFGSAFAESLPNITGEVAPHQNDGILKPTNICKGAFYQGTQRRNTYLETADVGYDLGFDASRSSSTYQDGAKVQPDHTKYPYYMVIANGAVNPAEVDLAKLMNDLLAKANSDFSNLSGKADAIIDSWTGENDQLTYIVDYYKSGKMITYCRTKNPVGSGTVIIYPKKYKEIPFIFCQTNTPTEPYIDGVVNPYNINQNNCQIWFLQEATAKICSFQIVGIGDPYTEITIPQSYPETFEPLIDGLDSSLIRTYKLDTNDLLTEGLEKVTTTMIHNYMCNLFSNYRAITNLEGAYAVGVNKFPALQYPTILSASDENFPFKYYQMTDEAWNKGLASTYPYNLILQYPNSRIKAGVAICQRANKLKDPEYTKLKPTEYLFYIPTDKLMNILKEKGFTVAGG